MAKTRRTPRSAGAATPVPASAFLADMRALATAPNPDAKLLVACDRFLMLHEESNRLYRQRARGYMDRVREMVSESNALEVKIANTPARTAAGRRAKAEAGLILLSATGTFTRIAHSALRDFMNSATSAPEVV